MITKICLIVIFICLSFLVMNRRVKMLWFAKFIMCLMMISSIAMAAIPKNHDIFQDLFFIGLAFIFSLGAKTIYERGGCVVDEISGKINLEDKDK